MNEQIETCYISSTTSVPPTLYCTYYTVYAGLDGYNGTGIASITEEYYLSTSKDAPTDGEWTTTPPTWSSGMYIWTRSKIIYSDPDAIEYTEPVCDNSWEAVNEVEVILEAKTDSIEASVTDIQTIQKTTSDAINSINDDINVLTNAVNTKMDADSVDIAITSALENGVTKVNTTTGFKFDETGLTVSKSGTEMTTQITEDGMTVRRDEQEMLTANNEGVIAYNLHAKTYLFIGETSRFEDYISNGKTRTGCFWVGETEVDE